MRLARVGNYVTCGIVFSVDGVDGVVEQPQHALRVRVPTPSNEHLLTPILLYMILACVFSRALRVMSPLSNSIALKTSNVSQAALRGTSRGQPWK
jgi:hypothetical protein